MKPYCWINIDYENPDEHLICKIHYNICVGRDVTDRKEQGDVILG